MTAAIICKKTQLVFLFFWEIGKILNDFCSRNQPIYPHDISIIQELISYLILPNLQFWCLYFWKWYRFTLFVLNQTSLFTCLNMHSRSFIAFICVVYFLCFFAFSNSMHCHGVASGVALPCQANIHQDKRVCFLKRPSLICSTPSSLSIKPLWNALPFFVSTREKRLYLRLLPISYV